MRCSTVCLLLVAVWPTAPATAQESRLRGFGPPEGTTSLPGFGSAQPLPALSQEDHAYAKMQVDRFDLDGDGALSREEVRKTPYKRNEASWFHFDADSNNRLSPRELAGSYARIRIDKIKKLQQQARAKRRASGVKVTSADYNHAKSQLAQLDKNRDRKLDKSEAVAAWGRSTNQLFSDYDLNASGYLSSKELAGHFATARISQEQTQKAMQRDLVLANAQLLGANSNWPTQLLRTSNNGIQFIQAVAVSAPAQVMVARYDKNGNGLLEQVEWQQIEGQLGSADADGDSRLTMQELTAFLARGSTVRSPLPKSPHSWFAERDANDDGQVSMAEYASRWNESLLAEFARFDRNQDGLISAAESWLPPSRSGRGREFSSSRATVIESGVGAQSSLHVDEDFEIADVNVHLSLAHAEPTQLDAFLVAPSGTRASLFSGAGKSWKSGNFEDTLFDDEATDSISDASPPFRGALTSEGAGTSGNQRLSGIYGERSEGVWRLFVRATRSQRAGLLHGWSLVLVPKPAE